MYKKSKILNDKLNIIFETILNHYTHAIAVVQNGDEWLLGRANTDDERDNKWCMPGGGMKKGDRGGRFGLLPRRPILSGINPDGSVMSWDNPYKPRRWKHDALRLAAITGN